MYRSRKSINWVTFRIVLVISVFALGTTLLVARAYWLHVVAADELKKRADKARTRVLHLEARRGMIFDRDGEQLAASLEVNSICASPRDIVEKATTARTLAEILELDQKEVLDKLVEDRAFVWIRRRVSPLVAGKVKLASLKGVFSVTEFRRFYPLRSLAAHAIGFAGIDAKGLEGLEFHYDEDLKTDPLPVTAQSDALGRPVMFASMQRGPGRRDLHLTLDRNIQYITEKELDEAVRKEQAQSGSALVMDADSGQILALAVRPTYNLNVFEKAPPDARRNRCVTDAFEPGSTFKVFLAAAALDLVKVDPHETFNCYKGRMMYKGHEIHDVAPHNRLNFEDVVVHSSNIGAVQVSEKLSKSEFYRVLTSFGFGSASGVDLPGERAGVVPLPGRWTALSKANIAFGQGITVNAVQLATAFAAAVNGGTLYRPHLMWKMTAGFGETVRENRRVPVREVIKPATSEELVRILREVVERGTGKNAKISGVDIIGKTGTAQKADPAGGYSKDKYIASFIGAVMSIKPRLVIFVILDEPVGQQKTGGKIAAPVFKRIAQGIVALYGGGPVETPQLMASADPGTSTTDGMRSRSIRLRKGPREGEWIVPDLKGMTMRQVPDVCGRIKCDAAFNGAGLAVGQTPKPGELFKEGSVLEVSFKGQSS